MQCASHKLRIFYWDNNYPTRYNNFFIITGAVIRLQVIRLQNKFLKLSTV